MSWFCSPRSEARGKGASMTETHIGRCYCGAVEIEVRGDPLEMGYCHCENRRRYSAAPVSAFTLWKKEKVVLTKGAEFLGRFKSSEISERRYCAKCAGHILVEHPTLGLMDVRIGALRNFPFKPKVHLNYAEYGPAGSRRMDGDLRGPQVSCAGAHESNHPAD
jgi:hypothetical protein